MHKLTTRGSNLNKAETIARMMSVHIAWFSCMQEASPVGLNSGNLGSTMWRYVLSRTVYQLIPASYQDLRTPLCSTATERQQREHYGRYWLPRKTCAIDHAHPDLTRKMRRRYTQVYSGGRIIGALTKWLIASPTQWPTDGRSSTDGAFVNTIEANEEVPQFPNHIMSGFRAWHLLRATSFGSVIAESIIPESRVSSSRSVNCSTISDSLSSEKGD
nr:hypothetical protein CFP56_20671 [Quercus suber]